MNAEPRTTVVNILVTKGLEIDEPAWCADPHNGAQFKPDVTHNGPEIAASFETPLGTATYLRARLTQAPYALLHPESLPLVAVDLDGDAVALEPNAVRHLTAVTRNHLDALDRLADEADRIRRGGQ